MLRLRFRAEVLILMEAHLHAVGGVTILGVHELLWEYPCTLDRAILHAVVALRAALTSPHLPRY